MAYLVASSVFVDRWGGYLKEPLSGFPAAAQPNG